MGCNGCMWAITDWFGEAIECCNDGDCICPDNRTEEEIMRELFAADGEEFPEI